MTQLQISDAANAIGAELRGSNVALSGFGIDTRTLNIGDLYIAIRGSRFDGHDFVDAAEAAGACALLVDRRVHSSLPQLIVDDTRVALTELARFWASHHRVPTIAITGSNGKTTIKEMVTSILSEIGPVLSTAGNLNNDIGVPLTLLRLRSEHRYAVIEMGANHTGEIAELTALAQPDVALISNIGPAHVEGFGSIDAISEAKAEIFRGVRAGGFAVFNASGKYANLFRKRAGQAEIRTFGLSDDCSVWVTDSSPVTLHVGSMCGPLKLQLLGKHNVSNAMAAAAATCCLGVSFEKIIRGLEKLEAVPGRLQLKHGPSGINVIDDTYNANPDSTRAAINVLQEQPSPRYLVLGDMAELGDAEVQLHVDMGVEARAAGIEHLITVGSLSRNAATAHQDGKHFDDHADCVEYLKQELLELDSATVLVKGSRSSRMEAVVDGLLAIAPAGRNLGVAEAAL